MKPSLFALRAEREGSPRARKPRPGAERKPEQPLLPVYLGQTRRRGLISRDQERALASTLRRVTREVVRLAEGLESGELRRLLGDPGANGADPSHWAVREAERFCERVVEREEASPGSVPAALVLATREYYRCLREAREELTVANLRLVVFVAKRYRRSAMTMMDLIQEGNLGLIRAVELFDPDNGARFSTYAFWWIKQSIERGIAEKERLIRLPVHRNERRKRVERARSKLRSSLGREPRCEEIAASLDWTPARVREVQDMPLDAISLDQVEEERENWLENLEDDAAPAPDESVGREQAFRTLARALQERLDARERRVICMRYGLGHHRSHTLRELGEVMGVSRERVRQIELQAINRLRDCDALADLLSNLGCA